VFVGVGGGEGGGGGGWGGGVGGGGWGGWGGRCGKGGGRCGEGGEGEVWRVVISVPTKQTFAQTRISRMLHLNECGSGFKHISVGALIM